MNPWLLSRSHAHAYTHQVTLDFTCRVTLNSTHPLSRACINGFLSVLLLHPHFPSSTTLTDGRRVFPMVREEAACPCFWTSTDPCITSSSFPLMIDRSPWTIGIVPEHQTQVKRNNMMWWCVSPSSEVLWAANSSLWSHQPQRKTRKESTDGWCPFKNSNYFIVWYGMEPRCMPSGILFCLFNSTCF